MSQLCYGDVQCVTSGPLIKELKRREERSAFTVLLALKRTQSSRVAARMSDVLRDVLELYACFRIVAI
jgi:hypothetical protein